MISFDIEPIDSEPWNSDPSQTFVIGFNGHLSIILNDLNKTRINFLVGGEGCSAKQCVDRAQAILNGISSECQNFVEELNERTKE